MVTRAVQKRVGKTSPARWSAIVLAFVAGIIAIVAGIALPLAPVEQSRVDIAWPQAGEPTESTALVLTNQTPHTLDVRVSAAAIGEAEATDALILATVRPEADPTATTGLQLSASDGELVLRTAGATHAWAYQDGDVWELRSSIHGIDVVRNGTAEETISVLPPQVDALITELSGQDASDLSVAIQAVDDSNNRPTLIKRAIMVVLGLALIAVMLFLFRDDRRRVVAADNPEDRPVGIARTVRGRVRKALASLSPTDLVLVGLLTLWIFIGPMTDDDGYYSTMSYNAAEAGYVGNYYQMFNQTFTPFTGLWQFFDVWQQWGGRSPVWLRVPSLVFGIVAWFVSRTLLDRVLAADRWWRREAVRLFLALVTFVWWASYAIGARPEPFAAMCTVVIIALLWRSYRNRTLVPAAIAVAVAAASFATHPIGVVAAAPLLVSIPMLWSVARENTTVRNAVARTVAVASMSVIALLSAFEDGTLNDMLTGQRRFALVEEPMSWVNEFSRYGLLWADIPMGAFSRRAVVLVGLVLLIWFVIYALWSRSAGPYRKPLPINIVGWSFGLSFILMWITTSKWTHHFGSLAAIGPLFIVIMCVVVPVLVARRLGTNGRLAPWLAPVAILSLVPAMIVSLRGPNWWAYEWGEGSGIGNRGWPSILGVSLANVYVWALLVVVLIAATLLITRRRSGSANGVGALWGVTALVSLFFTMTGAALLSTFVVLASPLYQGFTVGKAFLADPSGSECLADRAITVWDAAAGEPFPVVADEVQATGFDPVSDTTPERPRKTQVDVWTSAAAPSGVGTLTTPWYSVGTRDANQQIGVLVAGDFASGSVGTVSAEVRSGTGTPISVPIKDSAARIGWTTLLVPIPPDLADAADLEVRIVAADVSARPGASVTISAPSRISGQTLAEVAPPGTPTAVGWTHAFWFPCDRPMTIAKGVIEPPAFATTYGGSGIDNIWVPTRGGSLAGISRLALVNTPATSVGDTLNANWGRVHLFEYDVATDAYDLTQSWVTTVGWRSAFGPASQLVAP